jgi:hypothetical protein
MTIAIVSYQIRNEIKKFEIKSKQKMVLSNISFETKGVCSKLQ